MYTPWDDLYGESVHADELSALNVTDVFDPADIMWFNSIRMLQKYFTVRLKKSQGLASAITPDFVTPVEVASINLTKPTKAPTRWALIPVERCPIFSV